MGGLAGGVPFLLTLSRLLLLIQGRRTMSDSSVAPCQTNILSQPRVFTWIVAW